MWIIHCYFSLPDGNFLWFFSSGRENLKPVKCWFWDVTWIVSSRFVDTQAAIHQSLMISPLTIVGLPTFFGEWESHPQKIGITKFNLFFPRWTGKELAYSKIILACTVSDKNDDILTQKANMTSQTFLLSSEFYSSLEALHYTSLYGL